MTEAKLSKNTGRNEGHNGSFIAQVFFISFWTALRDRRPRQVRSFARNSGSTINYRWKKKLNEKKAPLRFWTLFLLLNTIRGTAGLGIVFSIIGAIVIAMGNVIIDENIRHILNGPINVFPKCQMNQRFIAVFYFSQSRLSTFQKISESRTRHSHGIWIEPSHTVCHSFARQIALFFRFPKRWTFVKWWRVTIITNISMWHRKKFPISKNYQLNVIETLISRWKIFNEFVGQSLEIFIHDIYSKSKNWSQFSSL